MIYVLDIAYSSDILYFCDEIALEFLTCSLNFFSKSVMTPGPKRVLSGIPTCFGLKLK